jgi:hypothetical protein
MEYSTPTTDPLTSQSRDVKNMADDLAPGGHVMKTNMTDDLILADGVALNLTLASDM